MRLTRSQPDSQISTKDQSCVEGNPFQEIHPRIFQRKRLKLPPIRTSDGSPLIKTAHLRKTTALSWSANFTSSVKNDFGKEPHRVSKKESTSKNDIPGSTRRYSQRRFLHSPSLLSYFDSGNSILAGDSCQSSWKEDISGKCKEFQGGGKSLISTRSVQRDAASSFYPVLHTSRKTSCLVEFPRNSSSTRSRASHVIRTRATAHAQTKRINLDRYPSKIPIDETLSVRNSMKRQLAFQRQLELESSTIDESDTLGIIVKPKLHSRLPLLAEEETAAGINT